jgi:hypothetical protein
MLKNMNYHTQLFLAFKQKIIIFFLTPLQHHIFDIDQCVGEKIKRLQTFANWTPFVP